MTPEQKKEINIEPAKNQREESVPLYEKYYLIVNRYETGGWYAGMLHQTKQDAINWIRNNPTSANEFKIISFDLPF